jgi:hypothetical protein
MELSEAIEKFKMDLLAVKADGKTTAVEINTLEGYLDDLLKNASLSSEARRQVHENNLAHYDAQRRQDIENFRAVISAGKEAINASIIINGGAVFALMSFMANAIAKPGPNYLLLFAYPLFLFGMGVLLGGTSYGTRYISQFFYAHYDKPTWMKAGHLFNVLSWLFTASAFLLFAVAVYLCYSGFLGR